jgi:dihydropteroate synthase
MNSAAILSDDALRLNPLVTGWDNAWRPTQVILEDGRVLEGAPDALRDLAARYDASCDSAPRPRSVSGPHGGRPLSDGLTIATLDAFARHDFEIPSPAGPICCGGCTRVMGIINTTPDSFSDGGEWLDPSRAVEHGLQMVEAGAHLLDVGGESTRPGAAAVSADEERRRIEPVVAELAARAGVPVSIDTGKAAVARAALDAGASIVNDVTALADPQMASLVAETGAALVLMHMQGTPRTMQTSPTYRDVVREVGGFLRRAMARAVAAGVAPEQVVVDPGIGFGKRFEHNAALFRNLAVLASLGRPILMGCSRKSLIQHAIGLPVERRLHATVALNTLSRAARASIIRVHDVRAAAEAAAMADAILSAPSTEDG